MTQIQFEKVQQAFEGTKAALNELWPYLSQAAEYRQENRLIPLPLAQEMVDIMARYIHNKADIDDQLKALLIEEGQIDEMEKALFSLRQQTKILMERQTVMDYFRTDAVTPDVALALEQSKRQLMGHCALPAEAFLLALQPFAVIVDHLHCQGPLSTDDFDLVEERISKLLARATDRGNLIYRANADISSYMDGSCLLLTLEEATVGEGNIYASGESLTEAKKDDVVKRDILDEAKSSMQTEEKDIDTEPYTQEKIDEEMECTPVPPVPVQEEIPHSPAPPEPLETSALSVPPMMENFSGYVGDIGLVIGEDASAKDFSSKHYLNKRVSQNPYIPKAMYMTASCKVIRKKWLTQDDSVFPDQATFDFLVQHKYLTTVCWDENGKTIEGYILTSKGQESFRRPDVIKKNKADSVHVPVEHTVRPDQMTPLTLLRFEMIVRLWIELNKHEDISCTCYSILDGDGAFAEYVFGAVSLREGEEEVFLIPGLFRVGEEEGDLSTIREAVSSRKEDKLIILRSLTDIPSLSKVLQLPEVAQADLRYTTLDDPFTWYNACGKPCRNLLGGDPPPEGGEQPYPAKEATTEAPAQALSVQEPVFVMHAMDGVIGTAKIIPDEAKVPLITPSALEDESLRPEISHYLDVAYRAMYEGRPDAACVLLQALKQEDPSLEPLYERFAYASYDPAIRPDYRFSRLQEIFSDNFGIDPVYDALGTAAHLRAFFSEEIASEHYISPNDTFLKDNLLFDDVPQLKDAVYTLNICFQNTKRGFDAAVLSSLAEGRNFSDKVRRLSGLAAGMLQGRLEESAQGNLRIKETRTRLFGNGSMIRQVLQIVQDDQRDSLDVVVDSLAQFLIPSATASSALFSSEVTEAYMDKIWDDSSSASRIRRHDTLTGNARGNIRQRLEDALRLGAEWVALHHNASRLDKKGLNAFVAARSGIMKNLTVALQITEQMAVQEEQLLKRASLAVLRDTIRNLVKRLEMYEDDSGSRYFYIRLLDSTHIALHEDALPLIEKPDEQVAPFDFCARIQAHLDTPRSSWHDVIKRIFSPEDDSEGYDFSSARILQSYLNDTDPYYVWPDEYDIERTAGRENRLKDQEQDLYAQLELAESNMWINEKEKERLLHAILDRQKTLYAEKGNFGFYCRAMRRGVQALRLRAAGDRPQYFEKLVRLKEQRGGDLLIYRQIEKMIQNDRFTVADDYIKEALNGKAEMPIKLPLADRDDPFSRFQKKETYDGNYAASRPIDKRLHTVFESRHAHEHNRLVTTGTEMLKNWPLSNMINPDQIQRFLKGMDLPVKKVTREGGENHFLALFNPPENLLDFQHPIADFGSKMFSGGLDVYVILGNKDAGQMNTEIRKLLTSRQNRAILFIANNSLALNERRELAAIIKRDNQKIAAPYMIMDRITALFVAEYPDNERWNVLLKCALPFQYLNPYFETNAVIPPEMFIGRREELRQIIDPAGANLIYGGRQLGKTALLQRAQTLEHQPDAGKWAVYAEINGCDKASAARIIARKLNAVSFFAMPLEPKSWEELMDMIEHRMNESGGLAPKLLLLLDETGNFIDQCQLEQYSAIVQLKRLQTDTANRFKFVLAGLHNVVRFHKNALKANGVIPQLLSQPIKPLQFQDACELLEKPLSYLGYKMKPDQDALIAQILSNTNYFPGLIHFYASRMIQSLCTGQKAISEPPYPLDEERMLNLLKNKEFLEEVKRKFLMTLELDSYYNILAYALAFCLDEAEKCKEEVRHGLCAERIKHCEGCESEPIQKLNLAQVTALLDELVELNILRCEEIDGEKHYNFSRPKFRGLLGSPSEIEDKVQEYWEKGGDAH